MSTLPFGDPAGQYISLFSFQYVEHVVPEGAAVVNYRNCKLCGGVYLPDSSRLDVCGRELCKAVRIAWAMQDAAKIEQSMVAVA